MKREDLGFSQYSKSSSLRDQGEASQQQAKTTFRILGNQFTNNNDGKLLSETQLRYINVDQEKTSRIGKSTMKLEPDDELVIQVRKNSRKTLDHL
ncbi:hypothetical protein [Lyngbya aestuarii]|uniref:hypothetical protein n=1 Tax=Lyngbya aestuarii TaxID=118322 RepID=UPI00403D7EB5